MNTTQQLLDRVKAMIGAESDYRLTKFLKWNQATVSSYRTGRSQLDNDKFFQVAEALSLSPSETLATLASIESERAKDDQTRATWQARLKRLWGIAATVTLCAVGMTNSLPCDAAQYPVSEIAPQYQQLTVFRTRKAHIRRRFSRLSMLFSSFFQNFDAPQHFAPAT